jgi:hypothetical protein
MFLSQSVHENSFEILKNVVPSNSDRPTVAFEARGSSSAGSDRTV